MVIRRKFLLRVPLKYAVIYTAIERKNSPLHGTVLRECAVVSRDSLAQHGGLHSGIEGCSRLWRIGIHNWG